LLGAGQPDLLFAGICRRPRSRNMDYAPAMAGISITFSECQRTSVRQVGKDDQIDRCIVILLRNLVETVPEFEVPAQRQPERESTTVKHRVKTNYLSRSFDLALARRPFWDARITESRN